MFDNKTVLITGGTGSFGKKFIAELFSNYKPKKVVVYSRDELKQLELQETLRIPNLRFLIGDVRERERLVVAMKDVDFVVHAAALKQVPSSEYNPMECIKTNIHGAENVVHAAWGENVEKVIALSTDKAVNPVNLYGATKLAADKLFVAANNMVGKSRTRFSVVRYGNVVGSRGSVVPFFKKLVSEGAEALPITDREMTRFFISISQGVQFVFKSFQRMCGGEIFLPKLPTVKIVDLASAIGPGLPQQIVGLRPGEKIHEIMCPRDDAHLTLEFEDHFVVKPSINMFEKNPNYERNILGEIGVSVRRNFEYSSGNNPEVLNVEQIKKLTE